jgi:hypothetical protein
VSVVVDSYKVTHWMNARKLTTSQLAERSGVGESALRALLEDERASWPEEAVAAVSDGLAVERSQISVSGLRNLTAVVMSAQEVQSTRRPVWRGGAHIYNYYSMAGAPGRVAPVILDILCPAERLPPLNNGHLEPAITVNLGPGDINGRWGHELTQNTWRVLRANRDPQDDWIVGDSYIEPSYRPHSYSLAAGAPARIVSYTAEANLAPLLGELNEWTEFAFEAMGNELGAARAGDLLRIFLRRRGFDAAAAAALAGVDGRGLERFLSGDEEAMAPAGLRTLGDAVGFDYRVLLPTTVQRDAVGKTFRTVEESRRSVRRFAGYTVASTATAVHLPDLTGMFVRVERSGDPQAFLDLLDSGETHYMVLSGELGIAWRDGVDSVASARLSAGATAWIAPFIEHGWWGRGALLKLGSGSHVGYLDAAELSNAFEPWATLSRGRHDSVSWGYEEQ